MRGIIFLITTCIVFNGYADWIQIGQDIDGEAANDESGHSVALSSDGAVFAIGTMNNDNNGANSGHVRVYQYTSSIGMWTQLGMDIEGEAANDQSGHSVALSSDGSIVAIGALGNDANANGSGHVRVYEFDGISWTQLGMDIEGEAVNFEFFGAAVDINADGTIVAIGAVGNDGNGNDSGYVCVYQYDGIIWNQLGMDIEGEAANDQSGHSVTLSSDGTIVAIGS
ncbi:MAG: hypothetical protein CMF29_05750, partial [Kiritimatiellaceae bacterium]|nr:hypothetical protein [Kiritimatiellaceae bacterium]